MNQDRGTIKWTSLMLPEHVSMLKSLWQEEEKPQPPSLDSQEQERLNHLLLEAASTGIVVWMRLYLDHEYVEIKGILELPKYPADHFVVQTSQGERRAYPFASILNLEAVYYD